MHDLNRLIEILTSPDYPINEGVDRAQLNEKVRTAARLLGSGKAQSLPELNQTAAIALEHEKTAALFFDRIWATPIGNDVPPEVAIFAGTDFEVFTVLGALANSHNLSDELVNFVESVPELLSMYSDSPNVERALSTQFFKSFGTVVTPMYESAELRNLQYGVGDSGALLAAVSGLPVVDDASLEWDQVLQFRSDPEAKAKLRNLQFWLDSEFIGKPIGYVTNGIEKRLEEYEWAIRKHGIKTVTGVLSDLIDVRFIAAAAPVVGGLLLAAGTGLAEIAAAGLALGKISISITNRLVDLQDRKRGQGSEVAFVHEIKKIAKK